MPWMDIEVEVAGHEPIKNVVNIDTIVRFGPRATGGSYIRFVDGMAIDVSDSFDEIIQAVLKARAK